MRRHAMAILILAALLTGCSKAYPEALPHLQKAYGLNQHRVR